MLFLLLTQQASLSHAVSHLAPAAVAAAAVQEVGTDTQEFAAHACELCVAAAQFAAVLPSASLYLPVLDAPAVVQHGVIAHGVARAPALAFRSRAPPFA